MVSRTKRLQNENQPRQDRDKLPRVGLGTRFVTKYDPEKALRILELVAEGLTLNAICRGKPGMPHPTTFRRWMVNYPDLAKAYEVAIRVSASALEEEALDMARERKAKPLDGTHVRATEVLLQQLRWSAERRDAAKFGQKAAVNVKVPVQIITPIDLNLGDSGNSIPDIYTIEAKVLKSPEQAAEETEGGQIMKPRRLVPGRTGVRANPFSRIAWKDMEANEVRTESDRPSDRQADGGLGDETVHQPGSPESEPSGSSAPASPESDGEH